MGPSRCRFPLRIIIAATALVILAIGLAHAAAGMSQRPSPASNTLRARVVVGPGCRAHVSACPATAWRETDARNDLLRRLAATPLAIRHGLHDAVGNTMDTAKVIQAGPGSYLAVYATGTVIKLASSTDLVNWRYVTDLDTSATQPYIARGPKGSYLVADEKYDAKGVTSGPSHLYFIHYSNLSALQAGRPDWLAVPPSSRSLGGHRFYSLCSEGTPDIHGITPVGQRGFVVVNFGFHYNAHCGQPGPDREAYGTFKVTGIASDAALATATWSATKDNTRDNAVASLGDTGSRGGRDDITWHHWRFSIQEAQCGSHMRHCVSGNSRAYGFASWRYVLFDFSNHRAYPVALPASVDTVNGVAAACHGNPKMAAVNDPDGTPVLVVTGYIFGPPGGCVTAGTIAGEFLYVVPAR